MKGSCLQFNYASISNIVGDYIGKMKTYWIIISTCSKKTHVKHRELRELEKNAFECVYCSFQYLLNFVNFHV